MRWTPATAAEKRFLAFCIVLVVLAHLALLAFEWRTMRPDFVSLYAAGRAAGHAALQPGSAGTEPSVLPGAPPGAQLVYSHRGPDTLHTPFELLIFAPLALLRYSTAYLLWYACNLAMLVGAPLLLWRQLPNLRPRFGYLVVLAATFFPVFVTLIQGQDSLLLLLLMTLAFLCMQSRRERMAGVVLALGMFKFTLILPVVAALALAKRRRVVEGFAAGLAVVLLITTAAFGRGAIPGYIHSLLHPAGGAVGGSDSLALMPNLRGFLEIVAGGRLSRGGIDAAAILLSILLFACMARRWRRLAEEPSSLDILYAMMTLSAILVSYHLYVHDASVLLLPALLTMNRLAAPQSGHSPALLRLMAASLLVFYAAPFVCPLRWALFLYFCASVLLLAGLYLYSGTAAGPGAMRQLAALEEEPAALRGELSEDG